MTKLLLALAVLASCVFLLTQFLTSFYFNNNNDDNNVAGQQQQEQSGYKGTAKTTTSLRDNVRLLVEVCTSLKIPCTLMHKEILTSFIALEKKHRETGHHYHRECTHFCGRRYVTFLVKNTDLQNSAVLYEDFIRRLSSVDFQVVEDKNYDKREATVERPRGGEPKILNHLYLERKGAFVHIVVSHPRVEHEWTYICNVDLVDNKLLRRELQKSIYCKREQLLEPLDTTQVVIDGTQLLVPRYLATFLKEIDARTFVPCHFDNARRFLSSYGYDSSPESELFRSKATNLLSIALDVLSDLGVPFWLSSGTCLGWFRQCDFIPHSKDVDIGIWIKDYKKDIISAFKDRGFSLKHIFGKIEDSFELSFKLDDMKLDIFFFYEDAKHMWNGGTQAKTGKKFQYLFKKFELCWTTLSKVMVRIPCHTERYIRANYGDSWHVLVTTWDWKASPPNVHENGVWSKEEQDQVIQVFDV